MPMAKTSSRSETKINKASKGKPRAQASARAHAEDDVDGFDVKILSSEATPDIALPPAKGGVGRRRRQSPKRVT
jgi:hypothetical protein